MHDFFDVVNLSEGEHSVDVEWKLYPGHTWRVDESGSNYDCGEERGSDLQLQDDAVLNVVEFDKSVDWSVNDTREGTTDGDGEWKTLLTTSEKIEENNVAIFRGFTSAFHPYAYDDTHGYQTRLLVDGNEVSRSSTSESNVFFNIASLLGSKRYNSDKTVQVKLQWRGDSRVASSGYDEYILGENAQSYDSSFPDENGSHARLGIIEFEAPVDYLSSSTDSGSAPSSWNTLEGVELSTDNSVLFTQAHVSASVSNDDDYFMRILVDGQEHARQSTGVSDDSAQDNMFLSTVESVDSGTFNIDSQWQTEGSADWEDSELVALGLENSTFDIKFCDRRGSANECISENEHDLGASYYEVSSVFRSLNTSHFTSSGGRATINVTNSSELSGTWKGGFQHNLGANSTDQAWRRVQT
jgi:hypothetical protein